MQGFVLPEKCLLISNVSPLALEALIASDYMNIFQTTVQLNVGFNHTFSNQNVVYIRVRIEMLPSQNDKIGSVIALHV